MKRVSKRIKCDMVLTLIFKALKAGYIESDSNKTVRSDVGTPRGSVLSPILCNIVLHELDKYIDELRSKFNCGGLSRPNPTYTRIRQVCVKCPRLRTRMLLQPRKLLASDPLDPNFRRLKYVRYAFDFVVLVIAPFSKTERIRDRIKSFLLGNCGLDLNMEKTIITNIQKEGFKFLAADCNRANMTKNHVFKSKSGITKRATTRLRVNIDLKKVYKKLVETKLAKYDELNKIVPRGTANNALINFSHADIIAFYNSKVRGLYNYYSFAGNRKRLNLVI